MITTTNHKFIKLFDSKTPFLFLLKIKVARCYNKFPRIWFHVLFYSTRSNECAKWCQCDCFGYNIIICIYDLKLGMAESNFWIYDLLIERRKYIFEEKGVQMRLKRLTLYLAV